MNFKESAIAQWIRLRLPSCSPVFESQGHLRLYIDKDCALFVIVLRERLK